MKLRIKIKLALGLTFMFIFIVLIGGVGLYAIGKLKDQSKTMFKANYESIVYAKDMEQALDMYEAKDPNALPKFETNLKLQENNITEIGEQAATDDVRAMFEKLKKGDTASMQLRDVRAGLYKISELNLNAIVRKGNELERTADDADIYLAIIVTLGVLISFTFLFNFPGYIANPVKELTEGIKQIANKNYSQRIYLEKSDEFGELAEAFNTMAAKLNEYDNSSLAKLMFEKKRIDTIINNMKDPIIGFDEKKNVLFVNSVGLSVLNIKEGDIIGKYAPDVALKNDLLRTLIGSNGSSTPLKIYADNKESYFTKEVLKIIAEGNPIGEVIMLKNITQYKELDLAKTNFIATISHELKTPISSIKMSLKLLEDTRVGALNEEQKKLTANIKDDTQRLLAITGELLDLTQVETGNIQLQKQSVEPRLITDYAYNALKVQAEQKKLHIITNIAEGLPKVNCDLEKTAWVLVNFLSNAIRYSPEGEKILMEVKLDASNVVFSVQDFGIGIDPRYKDKVFERFYKIPNIEREKSSTGLGLAISREFITAQGGKIWVDSEIGKGSVFYFSLPVS
jgi:signal transduction histidine kinase